jgi:hypothetical protein
LHPNNNPSIHLEVKPMTDITSHTTVMINSATQVTARVLPTGDVEVTFGRGSMSHPDVGSDPAAGSSVTFVISDPLTTIPDLQNVLQYGYFDAHRQAGPVVKRSVRKQPYCEPPGTDHRADDM